MRMPLALMVLWCAVVAASLGCGKGKSGTIQTKKIGGCVIETIAVGCGSGNADEAPADAAWIRLSSMDFAGNELYKKAALDLKRLVSSEGVKVLSCTELRHVKDGPCWPPYSIELKVTLAEQRAMRLRSFFEVNAIAVCRPLTERPEDYGTFFVSCGTGASDWWTVWYRK
ncbi:MAG: hypothetical protein PHD74_09505 [Candidatus Krumholzibacteria bacterium]|nr:hypothetical protein [Candidatus Krumholzibacteria bacterium]